MRDKGKKCIYIEDYLELVKDDNSYEYKLLENMYPFFDGTFNHHDIMMISNCSRSRIDKMLDQYNSALEKFLLK